MSRFIVARASLLLVGLALSTLFIFAALRVLPGDVAQQLAGTTATEEQVAALRTSLGLDRPLTTQYVEWIGGLVHLDLGNSYVTGAPVVSEIIDKATVTIPLGLLTLVIAFGLSIPLGYLAAVRHHRRSGVVLTFAAQSLAAIPTLWAGLLLILFFGVFARWLPTGGFPQDGWHDPWAALRSLALPAITGGIVEGAVLFRFVRSAVLEVISADFVRTGAAKGLPLGLARLREGLPNAGLTLFTLFGMQIAVLLGGSVLIENLFQLPGLGRMLVADVGRRDLIKVQSTILVITAFVLVVGALVDVAQRALDPRSRRATT